MKQHITVDINAEFGSKFQKDVFKEALETCLYGMAVHFSLSHKNNDVTYELEEHETND